MSTVLSLFSGCGGFDIGAIRAGYEVIGAYEIDAEACAAYSALTGLPIEQADLKRIDPNRLPDADGIIGGPPCQDFSIAGPMTGSAGERNLFPATINIIRAKRPSWFVLENVVGLTTWNKGAYFQEIKADLAALGYNVASGILNAADYGVPQTRHRVFIVGQRSGKFDWPEPTHLPASYQLPLFAEYRQADWIGWGEGAHLLEVKRPVPKWVSSRWDVERDGDALFSRRLSHTKFARKLCARRPHQPAFTVLAAYTHGSTAPIIWQGTGYAMTERFTSWIQSIPYHPVVTMKQLGNAVPPPLAQALLANIKVMEASL